MALPFRFRVRPLPRVRVVNAASKASVDCAIVDVGPWNTDDPYWENDERPQAETGVDRRGRATNGAGIDLTPAAAKAIGLAGKGKVDWEFIIPGAAAAAEEKVVEAVDESAVLLEQVMALLQKIEQLPAKPQSAEHLRKVVELTGAILDATARRPLIK